MDPRDAARFFQRYAKQYEAGAFATPLPEELAKAQQRGELVEWPGPVLAMTKRVTRDGTRRDFTGAPYTLPKGAVVVSHLARLPEAPVPDMEPFDYVYAYQEDAALVAALRDQGRERRAVRISAASEIIACYGREGEGRRYPDHDAATLTELAVEVPAELRRAVEAEVAAVGQWHDDYPYYNRDGSWSSVSLRGFKAEDPTWGIKPSEMSKRWWAEHPHEAEGLTHCEWTVLARQTPALMELIGSVPWWRAFERIRLLKLSGREGKGGKLLRHTDITDRAAGTLDGQICRFHLPIVTHPSVRTVAWDLDGRQTAAHFAPWRLYYLDQRKPHMVVNPSAVERVHLVVDVIADAEVRARIAASAPCVAA